MNTDKLQAIERFETNIKDFLENVKLLKKYKKKAEELEEELENGLIMDYVKNYNVSIQKYEKRILKNDLTVIPRVSNKIFAKLKMKNLIAEQGNEAIIWEYIKTMYLHTELILNPDRPDIVRLMKKCIGGKEKEEANETLDQRISQASEMLSKMFSGGDNESSKEMQVFSNLVKNVASQVGDQIKQNGTEIDSASVMQAFSKMMNGNHGDISIPGLDMNKVIENVTQTMDKDIKDNNIDLDKMKKHAESALSKMTGKK
jgi:hypothetical protein